MDETKTLLQISNVFGFTTSYYHIFDKSFSDVGKYQKHLEVTMNRIFQPLFNRLIH